MSSNEQHSARGWWQTLVSKAPGEKAFWFGIVLPLAVVVLVLKLWRIVERGEISTWWAAPDLLRSDLLVVAAFAAFGLATFRLASRRGMGAFALGAVQLLAIVWGALEVVAHQFFLVTGSTFDLHLLLFSLERADETWEMVGSETTAGSVAVLAMVVLALAALPWGLWAWLKRGGSQSEQLTDEEIEARVGPLVSVSIGAACVGLAILPPIGEDYTDFGRATALNLALSMIDVRTVTEYADDFERRPLDRLRIEPTDQTDEGPRNVAVIILESTRARSTTVHDPDMETTPFLAELAEESTVAQRAYATVPHTSKALVAMLCGIEPRLRMPITEAQPDGLPARCVAELLGDHDYRSVFLQTATERFEDRPDLVDNMGYDDFIPLERMDATGYEEANYFGYEDAIMLPYSRQWLEQHGDDPFFATYLTLTPHHDYLAPRERYGRHQFVEGDDKLNRYKNTLYYVDQFTRELLEQYRELGLYEDTLFVIMGDHGEAFGEHGREQHDNVIWEEGLHVPLLIYDPTEPEGERIEHPVSQIDLAPTIFEWLGYRIEGGEYPGRAVWETDEDRVVYSHCWYERRCMARIGDRLKYIDHFGRRSPEVYDIPADPREQNDLSDEYRDEMRDWRAEVYGWRRAVNDMYRRAQRDHTDDYLYDELPDTAVEQTFGLGDFARHLGYEIDTDELRRGDRVTVTHYFEVLDDIPAGWQLFVHGESGGEMLNLDHVPVDGMLPLDEWEPGTIVADEHSFRVPRDWSPGEFTLYLGIYHDEQGRVPVDGPADGDRRGIVFEKELR